ncbi:MAG: hypothetical protein HOQ24_05090 [Mycobacteriaceae bacterium]|nr:hypothetical protein [Mycobacteriaceae bacterium]
MSPPNAALLAHGCWLIGAALLLRGPIERALRRPRVWTAVVAANGLAMTAFLWHLTALFAVQGTLVAAGAPGPAVGSWVWWATRPALLAGYAAVTVLLIAAFRRVDRPSRPLGPPPGAARSAAGMVLGVIAVLGFSAVGFGGVLAGRTATMVVLPVTPLRCLALLAAAALLLRLAPAARAARR